MNKQQIKRILDGAPEGATHVSDDGYWKWDGTKERWYIFFFSLVEEPCHGNDLSALSDLREILELRERVTELEDLLELCAKDLYSSSGKFKKSTAIKMYNYVNDNDIAI